MPYSCGIQLDKRGKRFLPGSVEEREGVHATGFCPWENHQLQKDQTGYDSYSSAEPAAKVCFRDF